MAKTSFSQKKVKKRGISSHSEGIFFLMGLDFFFADHKSFFCKILCLPVLKSNKVIFFRFLLLNFLKTTKVFFEENYFSNFWISQKFFSGNFSFLIFKTSETFFSEKAKTFFPKANRIKSENKNPLHWLETAFILKFFRETQVFEFFPVTFLFFWNCADFISNTPKKC